MATILLAEDEPRISSFIKKGLESHEFSVTVVSNGREALTLALYGEFDLCILDVGLEGMDGFAVLEQLRGSGSDLPVIVLTARDSVTDRIAGLSGGADDYMAKPFSFEELLVRVRLRMQSPRGNRESLSERNVIVKGAISLDLYKREVVVKGKTVELSTREFALLEYLMRHEGAVLSREQVLSSVWGFDYDPGSNVVDVYIRYLRKKLGAERIETVRGVGYRFRA